MIHLLLPVIFLGDSLTAGYGLNPEQAYPSLVEKMIRQENLDYRVINAGSSGDTTGGGVRRLPWLLKQKPAMIIVALGANDMLRGLPAVEVEKNLDQILTQAESQGVKTAILGMRAAPNLGTKYQRDFDAIYGSLAKKHSAPLLPFYIKDVAARPKLNQADGIHPTPEGQRKIAERVARFLLPLLKRISANTNGSVNGSVNGSGVGDVTSAEGNSK